MKVYIPSFDRATAISTHRCFTGMDVTLVLHNEEQRRRYEDAGVQVTRMVVSGAPTGKGVTYQRQFIHEELAEKGVHYISADDNIRKITGLPMPFYAEPEVKTKMNEEVWRKRFKQVLTAAEFEAVAYDTAQHMDEVGAHIAGFALTENPFFRGRKWRYVGYVIGKLMVVHQESAVGFDHRITMEDFRQSAEHIVQYGRVVINNYAFPRAGHYEKGGLGTYAERLKSRQRDVELLLNEYPTFFKVKDRKGFDAATDVQVRLTNVQQVARFRRHMGRIRGDKRIRASA